MYLHISHYHLFLKCSWEGGAAAGTGSKRKSITWGDDEDDEIDEMEDPVDDEDQEEEDDYEGDGSGKERSLFFVLCAAHSYGSVQCIHLFLMTWCRVVSCLSYFTLVLS